MEKLTQYLDEIGQYIPQLEQENTKVSAANVGWHLEHTLITLELVGKMIAGSDPEKFKRKINPLKTVIFAAGKLPRGKAKAPEVARPKEDISIESLQKHLKSTRESVSVLSSLDKRQHFKHPYFDILNLKDSIKFLEMHTRHHLDIVRDILA